MLAAERQRTLRVAGQAGDASQWPARVFMLAVCVLILLTFGTGLDNKPVAEDFIRGSELLTLAEDRQFRPTFGVMMELLWAFAGPPWLASAAYHWASLGIHLVATLMLFGAARQLPMTPSQAAVVTLLFALYPRHHEPVFWPAATPHPLMTVFFLFSLGCYLRARRRRQRRWYVLAVLGYVGALLSSEASYAGLGLLLAYEVIWRDPAGGAGFWRRVAGPARRLAPFLLAAVAYVTILIVGGGGLSELFSSTRQGGYYHVFFRPGQFVDLAGYLSYTVLPFVPLRTASVIAKLGMAVFAGIVLGASLLWGSRLIRFGAVWVTLAVLPFVLAVPFGNADRYFYLPAVGFCLMVVGWWHKLYRWLAARPGAHSRRAAWAIGLTLLSLYGAVAIGTLQMRAHEWHRAGELVAGMLNTIYARHPSVAPGQTFYFLNLPQQYGQARFMGVGMRAALAGHYAPLSPAVYTSEDPELLAAINRVAPGAAAKDVFIYVYQDGQLVDRSFSYRDPSVRQLLADRAIYP